jgi:hypothetical protein
LVGGRAGYRPDTVRVLTSDDGTHWTDRGGVVRPNDASGNRFEVRFAPGPGAAREGGLHPHVHAVG